MARTLNRLTASKVVTAKGPRTYADGGHLYLSVDANNNRRWIFIYARDGRTREISLGTFPAVSLAEARKQRDTRNTTLSRGEVLTGPRGQKDAATFAAVAQEVIKRRSRTWRGKESARHWGVSIDQHCAALLNRPIAAITGDEVLRVLAPLHDSAPTFAQITRARVEDVFTYAQARGLLPQDRANPADHRRLRLLLPAAPKTKHRAALPYSDVPALVAELKAIPLSDRRVVAARALEFVILTALRVGEVCNARIGEFDFEQRLFTVPADRMKAGREHAVPLSGRAVEIVRELEALRVENGIVFPAQRMSAIDGDRLNVLLKTLRKGVTVHGCRSSFRGWCGDQTTFPREVAEAALAHVVGGVEGAYRRSNALEKRRGLMAAWAAFCGGEVEEKVVALRR